MRDKFSRFLERRTAEITAYRFSRHNQIIEERRELWTMALELKGLKGKAIKAGTVFERLNRAYDKLIDTGDAHAADVESLEPQLSAMQDDISFAVTTLGNSVAGSSNGATGESEKAVEKPKAETADDGAVRLGPHPDVPEVAETASQTFPHGS